MKTATTAVIMLLAIGLGLRGRERTSTPAAGQPAGNPMQKVRYSKSGYDITPLTKQQIAEIVKTLTPDQVRVTQDAGTEPPFCGKLEHHKEPGTYVCVVGGLPLFKSTAKFDSGTGLAVVLRADRSRSRDREGGREPRHGAHRDRRRAVGRAPRARLRRRTVVRRESATA